MNILKIFRNNQQVTMHMHTFTNSTFCVYIPNKKIFKTTNWEYTLSTDKLYRDLYLLLPTIIPIEEFKYFNISIKDINGNSNKYNLQVSPYYYKEIKCYKNYYLIPTIFFIKS